ncbi:hypothetical protein N7466_007496 [Penicillium verhagenii]|uniref:uncharacterized protein n=1 Tax=Penicillium verhagenii TaxID=1562060 RepID=UPI00254530D0|nr:uncharacterized protein N7466_007496 [Penicillium verhagenii]KAJ5928540.1 hypothetical protein N7466_007496 [Penicillium verhagenii]
MTRSNDMHARIEEISSFIAQNAPRAFKSVLQSDPALESSGMKTEVQAVTEACQELASLLTEPHEWLAQAAWAYMDTVALSIVVEMNIHRHIQEGGGSTSLAQLEKMTGGSIQLIKRIMRQCVKRSIFDEPEPEKYRHNARSICLLHHEFASLVHYLYVISAPYSSL